MKLKAIQRQVIVIMGASSGIGLATARKAAKAGARLVLAARSGEAISKLAEELNAAAGRTVAVGVQADVANPADVQRVAEVALDQFAGFDTWINNAGVSIYGRSTNVPVEEMRRLMDVNFWGQVHGSLEALRHFRQRLATGNDGYGCALLNVGSVESDRALPLTASYSASKHAVKGFTDALRMEVEQEGLRVMVTLIKPGSINTPLVQHARNYLETQPEYPPPVYAPEVAATNIVYAASHPMRDLVIGGGGRMITVLTQAPRLADKFQERMHFKQQHSNRPPLPRDAHNLYQGRNDLRMNGPYEGRVLQSSLYSAAARHPYLTAALAIGTLAALGTAVMLMRSEKRPATKAVRALGRRALKPIGIG